MDRKMEAGSLKLDDIMDPNPDIHALFCYYNELYFGSTLGACTVAWSSKRMTLCAGVCHYMKTGGCAIRLSEPLLKFRSSTDLKNTLLHEMIHAYLWLTEGNHDHDDHGPCFKKMMGEINSSTATDYQRPAGGYCITIYHSFTNEVNNYRTHHWKCQICGDLIKRAMNRAPSASDCARRVLCDRSCIDTNCHWHQHQRVCPGEYKKIAEPTGYQDKRKRTMITGKQDHEQKNKDEAITRKMNYGTTDTDAKKEGNVTSTSSHRNCLLETFYPILEKEKVNSDLDQCPVLDENDSEEFEEVLRFKKRKNKSEKKLKRISTSILTTEGEKMAVTRRGKTLQQSEEEDDSGSCGNDFNVIIEWKDWYACEREDDERGVEALINRRQERRKQEKMLKHAKRQTEGITQISWQITKFEDPGNTVNNNILEADIRKDLPRSDSVADGIGSEYQSCQALSLIQADPARSDSSIERCMVNTNSGVISEKENLDFALGCNHLSVMSADGNAIETCLRNGDKYCKNMDIEMSIENPSHRTNCPINGMEVNASRDTVRVQNCCCFESTNIDVKDDGRTSAVVDRRQVLQKEVSQQSNSQALIMGLQGRGSGYFIQLDDTDGSDVPYGMKLKKSIKQEEDLHKKSSCSESSTMDSGDSVEVVEKWNASVEISDSGSEEDFLGKSDLTIFTSKGHDGADEIGRKRIGTHTCLNRKAKREQKGSRERQVFSSLDQALIAECPVCGQVLKGDISEGDFNQQFNVHLDQCVRSHP